MTLTLGELRKLMHDLRDERDSSLVRVTIESGNSTRSTLLVSANVGRSITGGRQLNIVADDREYD